MDPLYLCLSRLKRRKFDESIEVSTQLLEKNPVDKPALYLKCKSLVEKSWLDDTEMEDEGVADVVLDDNSIAQLPRFETVNI
jgi:tetratricopeptide repeat protein 8